jgi:multidrug resistance protein MdtO
MAPRASERIPLALRELPALLAPFPGRLEFAARLALICALTTLVAEIYQTPDPALTVYVAFFVIKPDRATSVVLSIVMLTLITVIIAVVMLVTMLVIDQPLWRVVAMTLISFGLLFAASASKLKPIAGIIALIAAYALDLLGEAHMGEIATRGLLYAWLFVGIPAGVSIAVNFVLGPAPRRLARRALADRLRLAAKMLQAPDAHVREAFEESLNEGPGEVPAWLRLAGAEKTASAQDLAQLRQAMQSTAVILSLVDVMSRDANLSLPSDLRERAALSLMDLADGLEQRRGSIEIDVGRLTTETLLSPPAAAVLAEFKAALAAIADPPPPEPAPQAKAAGGFFLPDAFTNPAHVQYALKTTAAAMFCYVVYELLDWPGIHTCLITCYIVSLGTAAETAEKLTLRIVGALLGAAVGIAAIVFLMPSVSSIGALMAVVFLAGLAAAWIAAGSPRVSYIGLQFAFAFFLCVIQGPSPAFDMTIARDRVIGILFGNLVVALIFTQIWPVSVASRIDPAIASLLRRLAALSSSRSRPGRWALAAETQAAIGALDQDLKLTHYEPTSIRPAQDWLDWRRGVAQALASLLGPLLIDADRDPAMRDGVASRLERLAAEFTSDAQAAGPASGVETAAAHVAHPLVAAPLLGLERWVRQASQDDPEPRAEHARA